MYKKLLNLYRENPLQARLMLLMVTAFLTIYFLPAGNARFDNAVLEAVRLTHWYAQEHVILCLLPAFIIAGAIMQFIYRREEQARADVSARGFAAEEADKPLATVVTFFSLMIGILVFANWAGTFVSPCGFYSWSIS